MARLRIILIIHGLLIKNVVTRSHIRNSDENWVTFKTVLRDSAYRLPTSTKPEHYDISLTPYFEDDVRPFTFDGTVNIHINALEDDVRQIVMHCNGIEIKSILIFALVNDDEHLVDPLVTDEIPQCEDPYSFLRINTMNPLQLYKKYIIRIEFSGNLRNDMTGFYKSFYYDSSGTKRWIGTTQFQPGYARRVFPCYDEPSFKATFVVTINREADFSDTISNMLRDTKVELDNGRIAETFYKTPVMSTYLIAFVVSHYDKIATDESNPERPFDIYARDNAGRTGDWSLEVGVKLLAAMEKYTGIPYYKMQDHLNMKQVAIPDFSNGAMENWGLLTYRESFILYDPDNSNNFYKQRVANIIAHEITHMWFGNLVTCAWWDNVWLNEGFARLYTYFLTASVLPDLGFEIRFAVEQVQTALFADSIDSVYALTNSVFNQASVKNQFSAITYAKGASVLRMTQYLLGKAIFEKGLRIYLQDRKYNVSEPEDLFGALDYAANEEEALSQYHGVAILSYFKTWSEQAGYPLLSVSINHRTGQMSVVQERWERVSGNSSISTLYHVPVTWTRRGKPDFEDLKPSAVLTGYSSILQRETRGLEWVIFNKQQTGFYRVNYDEDSWSLITLALRGKDRTIIHESNRAQIVDDLFALARAGVNNYTSTLNVLSFLQFEDAYAPWLAAIRGFNFVRRRLAHDADNLQKIVGMIIKLSSAVTTRLGYQEIPDEPFMDGLLRMYLMVFLCNIDHEQCVSAAITSFRAFRDLGTPVPPNMRPWVYCTGLRYGNTEDFNALWSKYLKDNLASEKIVLLEALGCTQDADSITKYLEHIVSSNNKVRSQDFNTAFYSAITGNEENTHTVFNWLKVNKDKAKKTLGDLSTLISYITNRLLNEEAITKFEQWIKGNFKELESAYNTGIRGAASARSKLKWYEERLPELTMYLENGYQDVEVFLDPETTEQTTTSDSADVNRITCLTLLKLAVHLELKILYI